MLKPLQLDDTALWKERFRLPVLFQPQVAHANPTRGLVVSNKASKIIQLYTWDIPTGQLHQLTQRPDGTVEGWLAPDGQSVYYLDDQKGNEHGHVVRVPYTGGVPQDLTAEMRPYTLRGFKISQAGNRMAFMAVNADGYQLLCIDLAADGTPSAPRCVYQSNWETWEAVLAAQGEVVAMQSTARAGGLRRYSTIVVDTTTGQLIGELWDGAAYSVEPVAFAPVAGDFRLLVTSTRTGFNRPVIWNPYTGERTDLPLAELAGELRPVGWSPDGRQILLWHIHQGIEQLYVYDLQAPHLIKLAHPSGSFGDFKATAFFAPNGEIWTTQEDAAHPPRVLALDSSTGVLKGTVLTAGQLLPGQSLRAVSFSSSDGQLVQGWLGVPEGTGPFPTILDMHGGPHFMRSNYYDPEAQAWLDHGFAFLSINYRGSTSFGRPFQEKIWGNIGHWELEDMVAARNWLVEQAIAAPDAILLHGASYGGYLTLWGLGKRPELWAGGLALVPGADWLVSYEDSSEALKGALRAWFGGTPEEKHEQYLASSPTTYVANVQAPVLIIQGRHDTRVPPREVEVYEAKMRALGKPIEVIWYDAGHGSSSTAHLIEFTEAMLRFAYRLLAARTSTGH